MLRNLQAARRVPHYLCLALLLSGPAAAASAIGVTAALRGQVVRTASFESGAPIGQMSSGQQVFLGDDIKVGRQGRLQVMLLDETIFTLGANSIMRIDEFVYDPADETKNSLSTSITQGAFRFVSGQVAKRDDNAMTVKLPSATIGVRGTSVAGEVDEDGGAQVILLGPAPNNTLGLPAGAINVSNEAGVVDITRPGFVTEITTDSAPPAPPQKATPAQIRQLEQALSEDAVQELAEGLGIESQDIAVEQSRDTDGDGMPDSYVANEELADAILAATGEDGGVTNDAALVDQLAETLFGDAMDELSNDDRADMMRGINLGEDAGNLLTGDFDYLGPTTLADLADFGPTGSITFTGSGAALEDLNGETVGTFSLTQVWDFSNKTATSAIGGNFDMAAGDLGRVAGTFDPQSVQKVPFDEARGGAYVTFNQGFYSYYNVESEQVVLDNSVTGSVGGSMRDRDGNIEVAGETHTYFPTGTDLQGMVAAGEVRHIERNPGDISSFTTLTPETRSAIEGATNADDGYSIDVMVGSFLSNVDRKDGTSPTASVGEGMVNIYVREGSSEPGVEPAAINKADGNIFAMKRTVSEE